VLRQLVWGIKGGGMGHESVGGGRKLLVLLTW